MPAPPKTPEGILARATKKGYVFRAEVWDNVTKRRVTKTFPTLAAAKAWRTDTLSAVRKGTTRATAPLTIGDAFDRWLDAAEKGVIHSRSGEPYKAGTLHSYKDEFERRLRAPFGRRQLNDLRLAQLQHFADELAAGGAAPQTIRNVFVPLRALYAWALRRELAATNPTHGLALPGSGESRDRIPTREEAAALLAALKHDVLLWATALYTGLRRGELMALDWASVDLVGSVLQVVQSYDPRTQTFDRPKSKAGMRTVPIPTLLREMFLAEQRTSGLVFGRTEAEPFAASTVQLRARTAWEAQDPPLGPISLHECRHTYASYMIAAGVNIKALQVYMGHSSINVTMDRYGHLLPGNEAEAAGLLDAFLTPGVPA